jgi:hypothetical protein
MAFQYYTITNLVAIDLTRPQQVSTLAPVLGAGPRGRGTEPSQRPFCCDSGQNVSGVISLHGLRKLARVQLIQAFKKGETPVALSEVTRMLSLAERFFSTYLPGPDC